jgi:hypothetical protein
MQLRTDTAVLELKPGQLVALDDAAGTSVSTRCGSVWITEEGERADFVLVAGERRVIGRPGRTLIQAMQPSWVSIRPS